MISNRRFISGLFVVEGCGATEGPHSPSPETKNSTKAHPTSMIRSALRFSTRSTRTSTAVSLGTSSLFLSALAIAAMSTSNNSLTAQSASANNDDKVALSPAEWRAFTVKKVEPVTHDTKRVVFALPSEDHEMGMTVASCLMAKAEINGKAVIRPYTPANINSEKGFLELVVKGYPQGNLSKHIVELKEGDTLELKGPFLKFNYVPNQYKKIGFIAGGSGLTPCLQLAKEICRNPSDETEIVLVYANRTERDIILREELDALQYMYPQFKVHYVLDHPSEGWTGYSGYLTKEIIQELIPGPSDEHLVCVCGPPPMMNFISGDKNPDKTQGELVGLLKELGYTSKNVYKY